MFEFFKHKLDNLAKDILDPHGQRKIHHQFDCDDENNQILLVTKLKEIGLDAAVVKIDGAAVIQKMLKHFKIIPEVTDDKINEILQSQAEARGTSRFYIECIEYAPVSSMEKRTEQLTKLAAAYDAKYSGWSLRDPNAM